jgi:hypothetical protein
MRTSYRRLLSITLSLSLLNVLPALAQKPTPTIKQQLNMTPRIFLGGFNLGGDSDNFSGTLQADNPKCVLTVATNPRGVTNGVGPNGSFLLDGSAKCAGSFQLFLSNYNSASNQFGLPSQGGMGSDTGIYAGTFVIVKSPTDPAQQGQTVEWLGNYTQVFNIDPAGGPDGFCGTMKFCANLGSAFGSETFNGFGLSFLLELNGFTFTGPNQ